MAERVVVTGGAGFIGTHTVDALMDDGAAVLVIDDMSHASTRALHASCDVVVADVEGEDARDAIGRFEPTAILHLAAQGGVNRSWREPTVDVRINVLGTVNVLQAARDAGCRVVLASSGGAVYGATDVLPAVEDTPPAPRSPYGVAKLSMETYLGMFARTGGPEGIALRYGNPARKDDEADDTDAHPPLTAGTEVRHDVHEITVSRTTRSRRLKLRQPWNPGAPEEVSQS